ncbi:MAG: Tryptophan synthase alpha chain [Myxococcaceae bacterium]|nr:Tryptophan synthase alpha chain [Myxococcaceae bacterium]
MVDSARGGRLVLVLSLLAGCGARGSGDNSTPPADVPAATDRGESAMDAGVVADTGVVAVVDAGEAVDAGAAVDLGAPIDRGAPQDVAGCVASGVESGASACGDGVDNDCDGFRDCTDPGCDPICRPVVDAGCVASGPEGSNAQCADGVDNDCDGYTDCVDFGCSMSSAVTICPRADAGPPDAGCVRTGTEDNTAACADRVDNDCDGYVDCIDFDCQRATVPACPRDAGTRPDVACVPTFESSNAACADGVDNDCDGFTDCADHSCTTTCLVTVCVRTNDAGACVCRGPESTAAACSNGLDDDCDGFTDCADFDCSMNPSLGLCRDGG